MIAFGAFGAFLSPAPYVLTISLDIVCAVSTMLRTNETHISQLDACQIRHFTCFEVPSNNRSADDIDLSHILRKQKFFAWLVAFNDVTSKDIQSQ